MAKKVVKGVKAKKLPPKAKGDTKSRTKSLKKAKSAEESTKQRSPEVVPLPTPASPAEQPTPAVFARGEFTLNSGAKSKWKLECDALTDEDWECLAYLIWQMVGRFSGVTGVPSGGLKLAKALEQYSCVDPEDEMVIVGSINPLPHLIVDDVLTTGNSMHRTKIRHEAGEMHPLTIGAVVFARGRCPSWITPLFQMPEKFWINVVRAPDPVPEPEREPEPPEATPQLEHVPSQVTPLDDAEAGQRFLDTDIPDTDTKATPNSPDSPDNPDNPDSADSADNSTPAE